MDNPDIYMDAAVPIGLGCALDMFTEKDEVMSILNSLPEIFSNPSLVETTYQNYQKILDRYQEQPHLLDSQIDPMIHACLQIFRSSSTTQTLPLRHLSLKFLRHIFKVRGPKEVVKRMPHEVSDLVPVLNFVETLHLDDGKTWESSYVLIMWLSILIINPFHLKLLDGVSSGSGEQSVAERIRTLCMKAVVINNNVGKAAVVLISNYLTRPDMQEVYMGPFIDWACKNLNQLPGSSLTSSSGSRIGAFGSLASLFKHGKREEMLKYGEKVLKALIASEYYKADTLIRKLGTKLIQRIGMMFMKTKLAPWRYQRGCRSLLTNLQASAVVANPSGVTLPSEDTTDTNDYSELIEYSSDIETILDLLLDSLKDKDTVVRWSAAKGIGRVTNRLPRDYGDEVVQSILKGFTDRETSGTWHGGCMALAELGRRGLLLPDTLPVTIPLIKKALIYDEIRGNFSVGGHVRDAACYVLWAFARAFEPHVVQPYAEDIASALIITMLFDREINCRRAASAAFQENVGRQGNLPHGIEIITIADYFTLGIRTDTFTKVSLEVARFPEYIRPMVNHLVDLKFNYYDLLVRELTSQALANLARLDPEYVRSILLERILPVATAKHAQTAQGAIMCVSNIMVALTEIGKFDISDKDFKAIRDIAETLVLNQFREITYGYIPLREATCYLILCCSSVKFPVHEDEEILKIWYSVLIEGVSYCAQSLREMATRAMPVFLKEFYYSNPTRHAELKVFLRDFCHNLKSNLSDTRMGYAVCLGKLPPCILKDSFEDIVKSLSICSKSSSRHDIEWAEVRRDALHAIAKILAHGIVGKEAPDWETGIPVSALDVDKVFENFIYGLSDYTTDKRGDVGSWVREASMTGLMNFIIAFNKFELDEDLKGQYLTPERMTKTISLIVKQCVEKIDNVRVRASEIFTELLLFDDPPIHCLPHREVLTEIFPREFLETVSWRSSSLGFPKFAELLRMEDFTYNVLSGFVLSGGSMSDSVLKDSNGALSNYILEASQSGTAELERIGKVFIEIFKNNQKVERVTLPLMKFLTQLLQSGLFLPILTQDKEEFGIQLADCIKNECARTNRVEKIAAGIELLCELMQGSVTLIKIVLRRIVIYLCHTYPRVRILTAEKLYEALNTYGDVLEDSVDLDAGMSILSDTQWVTESPAELRPIRNHFCVLLDIPIPTLIVKE